jgi:hypothetical protein
MDIARVKEDSELTESNTKGFKTGDHINISIKFDGTNASFRYDEAVGKLAAFSRKQPLTYKDTLFGFWNFVETLDADKFKDYPDYVFFGEWAVKNKISYKPEYRKIWLMYDVYDTKNQCYLPQSEVKALAEKLGFQYIHVLYDGEFVSWEHCRSFMNEVVYSESIEEGIVIKNQTNLNNSVSRDPFVLKIVNEQFAEVMKHQKKEVDPEKEAAKCQAESIANMIVTRSRVEKELYKMRDEGILPEKISPEDMKLVAKNLPKRIYDDCVKEENEYVMAAGEYFGKLCGNISMKHARNILLG